MRSEPIIAVADACPRKLRIDVASCPRVLRGSRAAVGIVHLDPVAMAFIRKFGVSRSVHSVADFPVIV